ncbi:MAG: BatA domain-containing protein [Gemmatimonadota bacterium]|nr:BatA domain-containing protein [Gemmatimonadota bacterium]
MTFLAPGFFFASLAVAAGIVALHFIVTRQPRAGILPTARFVPDTHATTVAPARRPSDLLLMLLRVLLILAAGAGMAKPVLTPRRGAEARVILVDVSRSARDSIATRDSVRAIYRNGDAVVLFDSSTHIVAGNVADTLGALRPTIRRGNLSAALIAALRAGSRLRDHADSLELVIVSPFAREELDPATDSIRKLWPGKARLVKVGSSTANSADVSGNLVITADANDPLPVTVALARVRSTGTGQQATGTGQRATGTGQRATTESGLIDRGNIQPLPPVTPSRGGGLLIEWPASTRPRFAVQRTMRDTVGGVMAGEAVVVAAFDRQWRFPSDSLRGGEVIARWVDGEPAAIEKPDGAGCVRSVAVPVTPVGDLVIRHDFVHFVATLSRACAQKTAPIPADPVVVAKLEGKSGLAPREAFQPLTDAHSDLAPWLFALAIAAAIAELFVRRRDRKAKATSELRRPSRDARAA